MLTPFTLGDVLARAAALNKSGRKMPEPEESVAYQEMVWERILSLCTPLNLTIPYNDGGIARISVEEDGVQWYVKSPVIAKSADEYIDIDSRLKEAFVFYFVAFLAVPGRDNNREEFETRGDMSCVTYACDLCNMGLSNAKRVYEQFNGITGITFNCAGARYEVSPALIDVVIGCMVCGNVCTGAAEFKQLEKYKQYLEYMKKKNDGDDTAKLTVIPSEYGALRALDIALFFYLLDHPVLIEKYGNSVLDEITTLSCQFGKIMAGEEVDDWVKALDIQLGAELRSL